MVVVDTDILIDFLNSKQGAPELITNLINSGEILFITQINEYELLKGAFGSKHSDRHVPQLRELLSHFKYILLDPKSIELGAQIHASLLKEGNTLGDFDILIASMCIIKNQKLLTRNVKDFSRIKELDLYK